MIRTEILRLSKGTHKREITLRAGEVIKRGGVVAFPTETVYALGADAMNKDALKKIFRLKKREAKKPIAIFISGQKELNGLVEQITPSAKKLMKMFWPGPLTLIFKAKSGKLTYLTGEKGKLGIRFSSSKLVQSLVRQARTPLTATSANLSGAKEPVSSEQVIKDFKGKIEIILDGGCSNEAIPSSVVDVCSDIPILIREGRISFEELKRAVPDLKRRN